jgi:hypothetical protein
MTTETSDIFTAADLPTAPPWLRLEEVNPDLDKLRAEVCAVATDVYHLGTALHSIRNRSKVVLDAVNDMLQKVHDDLGDALDGHRRPDLGDLVLEVTGANDLYRVLHIASALLDPDDIAKPGDDDEAEVDALA